MEVAFWELAPYFPNVTPAQLTPTMMNDYIRLNAGKAFEFMVEKAGRCGLTHCAAPPGLT